RSPRAPYRSRTDRQRGARQWPAGVVPDVRRRRPRLPQEVQQRLFRCRERAVLAAASVGRQRLKPSSPTFETREARESGPSFDLANPAPPGEPVSYAQRRDVALVDVRNAAGAVAPAYDAGRAIACGTGCKWFHLQPWTGE